jgi:hypothetical protein
MGASKRTRERTRLTLKMTDETLEKGNPIDLPGWAPCAQCDSLL